MFFFSLVTISAIQLNEIAEFKDELRQRYKDCKELKQRERLHALLLVASGYPQKEVAKIFLVDEDTIGNWVKTWLEEKRAADKPRSGRPKEINSKTEEEICQLVDENNPREHGINASMWDSRSLSLWLKEEKGIDVTEERIRQLLVANGFKYVKAEFEPIQADENKRQEFKEKFAEVLRELPKWASVLFLDEMSSSLGSKKGYGWTRQRRLVVRVNASKKRTNVVAAVNPLTGNKVTMKSKTFNKHDFIRFLKKIMQEYRHAIYLFTDGAPAHIAKEVKEFLKAHPRLNVIFLPAYSPDLNPAEQLWNHTRIKCLNNRLFMSVKQMNATLDWFFRSLGPPEIKRICNCQMLLPV